MLVFKKLKYKNFLSSGDNWTEVRFDLHKHTLVVGHNGAGKSTMLDALSFALFGKAHRNINKPQLVNSINRKNCLVEVDFQVGKNNYFVRRGISPGIFEIWINGEMMNQTSTTREYQKILEQNILKLNHKSFHQIVVLGSSSFIPFMQLSPGHRREVIEDLLDINVFSKMNQILKERNNVLKDRLREVEHKIDLADTKITAQKKYIRDLQKLNSSYKKEKEIQMRELQEEISVKTKRNEQLLAQVEKEKPDNELALNRAYEEKQNVLQSKGQLTSEIKQVVKTAKFYDSNEICPTCHQELDEDTKENSIAAAKEKARILKSKQGDLLSRAEEIEARIVELNAIFDRVSKLQSEVNSNLQSISAAQRSITKIEKEVSKLSESSSDLEKARTELTATENDRREMYDDKFKMTDEYQYNSVMVEMLKDTGIKTKVIKQYVPVINKLVNQYLQVLDFFVSFTLDESFTEEIKSRHRDTFSYESFSEGEKQRIDLALLFTWRQVARMKNSVATNLLVLDETFDSSLDHEGVENLMKILYTLSDDTNVFVISHKGEILDGKFESRIEFVKEKNFSVKR